MQEQQKKRERLEAFLAKIQSRSSRVQESPSTITKENSSLARKLTIQDLDEYYENMMNAMDASLIVNLATPHRDILVRDVINNSEL
jgi:hypothetical protein